MHQNPAQVSKTVMIVDDELFFRKLLGTMLTENGFSVVAEAADGVEAVEKYSLHRPELIILDIYMPKKSGFDATEDILSMNPRAKVVICSGLGYDEDVKAALALGARDVILKPFIPQEVIEIVSRVLAE
ncbi:MAG: response regulator [Geobacteraceae bacterium]|jgi:two-component system chemotaxis response regulator CheY